MESYPFLKRVNIQLFIQKEVATIVWSGWIERMEKAHLTRLCRRKVAHQITLLVRVKNERFYGYSWAGVTLGQFIEQLNINIKWYAEKRIKLSFDGMSPLNYGMSLGVVV